MEQKTMIEDAFEVGTWVGRKQAFALRDRSFRPVSKCLPAAGMSSEPLVKAQREWRK
jgi:hypothetical protein